MTSNSAEHKECVLATKKRAIFPCLWLVSSNSSDNLIGWNIQFWPMANTARSGYSVSQPIPTSYNNNDVTFSCLHTRTWVSCENRPIRAKYLSLADQSQTWKLYIPASHKDSSNNLVCPHPQTTGPILQSSPPPTRTGSDKKYLGSKTLIHIQ